MSQITRTYTFTDGTDAFGSQVESEISNIVTTWNNHDAGTSRWTVLDATTIKSSGFTSLQILQIVQSVYSTTTTTTSSAYSDTGLTATITPKSTSSKIMVLVSQACYSTNPSTCRIKLLRGASTLATVMGAYPNLASLVFGGQAAINYLDTPASVAALTYKTQFSSSNNTQTVGINGDGSNSYDAVITLIEVL